MLTNNIELSNSEVKSVEQRLSKLSPETTDDIPQLEEQDVKEILHDVLNELYYSKGKKPTHNGNYGRQ